MRLELTPSIFVTLGKLTPKALANPSPGLEAKRQPWVEILNRFETLKGFLTRETLSGLNRYFDSYPQGLANAFGVSSRVRNQDESRRTVAVI